MTDHSPGLKKSAYKKSTDHSDNGIQNGCAFGAIEKAAQD